MSAPFRGPYSYPLHHIHKETTLSIIAEVEKNSKERIRISIEEYKSHKFIDCRAYYEGSDGEWKPTRKGIALNADVIDEVIAALQKGSEALEESLSPLPREKADRPTSTDRSATNGKRNVSDEVRRWVFSSNVVFMSSDVVKGLGLSSREESKNVSKALERLRKEGLIERTGQGRGNYRRRVAGE